MAKYITVKLTVDQVQKLVDLLNKDLLETGKGNSQEKFEQHAFNIRLLHKINYERAKA